jgi:ribonuclease R
MPIMKPKNFEGPISINSKGVGFFDPNPENKDKAESIEIQPENVNRALHGDIVLISLLGKKIKNREQGKVEKIVKRNREEFVGVVVEHDGKTYVVPDDKRIYVDIFLPNTEEVELGQKVLVKISDWDTLSGEIIKVIGKKGENNTEMESIVLERGFRVEFPPKVEEEAEKIKSEYKQHFEEELKNRRDMRDTTTMTIDPADAKDFDDAISFKELGNDTY